MSQMQIENKIFLLFVDISLACYAGYVVCTRGVVCVGCVLIGPPGGTLGYRTEESQGSLLDPSDI
jgi:hypothetical protein